MIKYHRLKIVTVSLCLVIVNAANPGPMVIATKGAVWPKVQQQNGTDEYFLFRSKMFDFSIANSSDICSFLQNALGRYRKILQDNKIILDKQLKHRGNEKYKKMWLQDDDFLGYIDSLTINLTGECNDSDYPNDQMDESYKIWVTSERRELQANSLWGILRGLETFSHLVYLANDGLSLRVNSTIIKDFPRYRHRGLLIDTARHYLPLDKIYLTLDAMSYNKMNVLHWHIVDDQSFPYVSQKFPELSELGAYNRYTKVYYPEDIQNVIEYARQRGVRVIPEFDTPGHTSSWGLSHPEILTPCQIFDMYGPMDPSKNSTFAFLADLLDDIRKVFKDDFIHLGGDEVEYNCWMESKNITNFMDQLNITTYEGLEGYYIQRVIDMVDDLKYRSIVWEEVFSNGVKLPNQTIVQVWKLDWTDTMKAVTAVGKYCLLSACWYLDSLSSGGDWSSFYFCDPSDFKGTLAEQQLVLGGEACMWGEVVDEHNIISRVWPRASATAEKLWSAYSDSYDLDEPARRLEEHTCRMNRRGVAAQPPNGPGYCD